jgi:citrate lyase synthetase
MKIIKYNQKWDFNQQHHIQLMDNGKYIGGGYISESNNDIMIYGVYVEQSKRNNGYGLIIINELMNEINRLGFNECSLMVKKEYKNLIKTYKSFGFIITNDVGNGVYTWMKWDKNKIENI